MPSDFGFAERGQNLRPMLGLGKFDRSGAHFGPGVAISGCFSDILWT